MKPLVMTSTLVTEDGVPIDAVHLPALWASQMSKSEELAPPTLPPDREDLVIQRILIRHGFTQDMADMLLLEMQDALDHFTQHPPDGRSMPAVLGVESTSHDHSGR